MLSGLMQRYCANPLVELSLCQQHKVLQNVTMAFMFSVLTDENKQAQKSPTQALNLILSNESQGQTKALRSAKKPLGGTRIGGRVKSRKVRLGDSQGGAFFTPVQL